MTLTVRTQKAPRASASGAHWSQETLKRAMKAASARVMRMPGVTGIGLGRSSVRVYLESSAQLAKVKKAVREQVDRIATSRGVPLEFKVLGRIVAQSELPRGGYDKAGRWNPHQPHGVKTKGGPR